jgi:hypothetical protein
MKFEQTEMFINHHYDRKLYKKNERKRTGEILLNKIESCHVLYVLFCNDHLSYNKFDLDNPNLV